MLTIIPILLQFQYIQQNPFDNIITTKMAYEIYEADDIQRLRSVCIGEHSKKPLEGSDITKITDIDGHVLLYVKGSTWELDPSERLYTKELSLQQVKDMSSNKKWSTFEQDFKSRNGKNVFVFEYEVNHQTDVVYMWQTIPVKN